MKPFTLKLDSRGFTLVETIGATAVFMITVTAVVFLFSESFMIFYSGNRHIQMQQDADWALEAIACKVRQGKRLTFSTPYGPGLGVMETAGTNIYSSYYYRNGNNQLVYVNGADGGKSYTLLPNSKYYYLSNLTFSPIYSNRGVRISLTLYQPTKLSNNEVLSASFIAAVRNNR